VSSRSSRPAARVAASPSRARVEYELRVNRVIDHIRDHLADELSLDGLACIAAFSPFHFHRIFRAITGETLFGFVQRIRLERAATALVLRRDESILAIALDHGFSAPATFARAFRARFGMSATAWRAGGAARWRKHGKAIRKPGKASRGGTRHRRAMNTTTNVRVVSLPSYRVAYMRHVGAYGAHGIPELWQRMRVWMEAHGLLGPHSIALGIGRDDPEVTAPERLRYDACVVVADAFEPDGHVNVTHVPGGRYAVREFVGTARDIGAAWESLYRDWLPGSGFQPEDRPCLEIYRGDPAVDGKPGTFRCELCVPVKPL